MEVLLLILWRHLSYYLDGYQPNVLKDSTRVIQCMDIPDPTKIRSDIGKKLEPILQRLSTMDIVCFLLRDNILY
jgi:nuclear pore complex protein Nup205